MAYVNFIELYDTIDEALTERTSPQIDFYAVRGIHLLPNNTYPYVQTTNNPQGIELEDWTAFIVNAWDGSETDVSSYFMVEDTFNDENGLPQFTWSLTNIPFDFGNRMVYLKVNQLVGDTFYSNLFQLTNNNSERTTRIDYKNSDNDLMQSIQLKMWYWQTLKNQDVKTYYEVSTKNTVTNVIKSQKYERWITEVISNSLYLKLTDVFEYKFIYVNLLRCNLFDNLEVSEHGGKQNFAQNVLKLAFKSSDVYDPTFVAPTPLFPTITLSSVVTNGISAIYTFSYANFTPDFVTLETSQDQVTWSNDNKANTSPQSIPFTGTGTWYFRISTPNAISNIIQLDLGSDVVANNDSFNVVKGASIDINPLFNDVLVGTTTITNVTVPTNGTAVIINGGLGIRYTHNDSATTTDSFDYTISNGITSDTATINATITEDVYSSFELLFDPTVTKEEACSLSFELTETVYISGAIANPSIGDIVYDDSSLVSPFVGENLWYQITGGKSIKINDFGVIVDIHIC